MKITGMVNQPVVICHGWDDSPKKHFIPWLKETLEKNNWKPLALDFPSSEKPEYEKWKEFFEKQEIDFEQTIFI